MSTVPYKFQEQAIHQIHREFDGRALLAHEPGLGKTLMSLLYAKRYLKNPKVLVVCPAVLKVNWQREARKHVGIRAIILNHRKPKKSLLRLGRFFVINYEILKVPSEESTWTQLLIDLKPDLVILDEGHRCKGRTTICIKACRCLARACDKLLILTGTPILNRPAELWPILNMLWPRQFPAFLHFGLRYCLPPDAPILMANLTEKPIKDVKIGDRVIGWGNDKGRRRRLMITTVKDTIQKEAPLQKVILESREEFICTPDHKWATGYSHDGMDYRVATMGTIGGRGRGCASRVMKVWDGIKPIFEESINYKKGYIHGFFRGDGWCSKHEKFSTKAFRNKTTHSIMGHSVGAACKDEEPIIRVSSYLTFFGMENEIQIRKDGLWEIEGLKNGKGYEFISQTTKETNSDEWWAGFLGGIYDAEGSGSTISQYEKVNPITFKMIEKAFHIFGIKFRNDYEKSLRILGGRKEFLRFWNIANPSLKRKLITHFLSKGGKLGGRGVGPFSSSYVKKITPISGIHKTYTLTTGTGNYIAYGLGSKNCAAKRTRWGWDFRGASNLDELFHRLTDLGMIRRRKSEVLKDLPKLTRSVIPVDLLPAAQKEYQEAEKNFTSWIVKEAKKARQEKRDLKVTDAEMVRQGHLIRLAGRLKLPLVIKWIDDFFESSDSKLLVFGIHRKVLLPLLDRYKRRAVLINGSTPRKKRQIYIDRFNNDKNCNLFLGNLKAAGQGWNCTSTSEGLFTEIGWIPGDHAQAEGRPHGIGRGQKGVAVHFRYLVAVGTIEEDLCKVNEKKSKLIDRAIDGGRTPEGIDTFTQLRIAILRRNQDRKALSNVQASD